MVLIPRSVVRKEHPEKFEDCKVCDGKGELKLDFAEVPHPCPRCDGYGYHYTKEEQEKVDEFYRENPDIVF